MVLKAVLAWVPMVILAILNGAIREKVYGPAMSELRAHQVSTLIGMFLFWVYVRAISVIWGWKTAGEAWKTGFLWVCLTVLFELVFGRHVMRHSWGRLLRDYNILQGRIWLLILVWTGVLPYVVFRMRG